MSPWYVAGRIAFGGGWPRHWSFCDCALAQALTRSPTSAPTPDPTPVSHLVCMHAKFERYFVDIAMERNKNHKQVTTTHCSLPVWFCQKVSPILD